MLPSSYASCMRFASSIKPPTVVLRLHCYLLLRDTAVLSCPCSAPSRGGGGGGDRGHVGDDGNDGNGNGGGYDGDGDGADGRGGGGGDGIMMVDGGGL